jgi:hypothetical protein
MVLPVFSAAVRTVGRIAAACRKMHFGEHEIGMEECIH